jgi:hypothetical protein
VVDPHAILDRETEVPLDPALGGAEGAPGLRIMEWKPEAKSIKPSMILCASEGVVLREITEDMDTRTGIPFTGYLTWAGFAERVWGSPRRPDTRPYAACWSQNCSSNSSGVK